MIKPMIAVVYPYFSLMDLDALKTASIYFDRVYILNPISIIHSEEIPLYREMILSLIDEFGDIVKLASLEEAMLKDPWINTSLELEKVSNPMIKAGIIQAINPFDEFKSFGLHTFFSKYLRQAEFSRFKQILKTQTPYDVHVVGSSLRGISIPNEINQPILIKSPSSIVKNVLNDAAMVLAVSRGAIPLAFHDTSLKSMNKHISKAILSPEGNDHIYAEMRRNFDGLRIAYETIANQLPSFSEISFEQILDLREEQKDALQAFRGEMLRCATQIKCFPRENDYEQAIVDITKGTIAPAIQQLRESLRGTRLVFVQKLINDVSSMTGLATFIGSVYVGLPLHRALLLSATVVGGKAAMQAFLEKKKIRDNHGLRLLLRIEKETQKNR